MVGSLVVIFLSHRFQGEETEDTGDVSASKESGLHMTKSVSSTAEKGPENSIEITITCEQGAQGLQYWRETSRDDDST